VLELGPNTVCREMVLVKVRADVHSRSQIIDGSRVQVGDRLLGLASSGPHSNGYSLVRKVLEKALGEVSAQALQQPLDGRPLSEHVMAPTRIYVKPLLPLLPLTASCLKVPAHVAVVSTTGWAHGFKFTGEKLVYCHSPARWLYLRDQYLGDEKKNSVIGVGLRVINPLLRFWDQRAAARSEHYVANSTAIQKRIARVYGKDVPIIFPPYSGGATRVEEPIAGLQEFTAAGDYFLLVSRLMSYKNVDEAIKACNRAGKKLLIIGHGPEKDKLLKLSGPNVRIISGISDEQLCSAYRHCLALLAVSHEDFGITPLEAGASGKPVIAYRAGGYLDTIREGLNGVFIEQPTSEQIEAAIRKFNPEEWDKQAIKNYIARFSEERFIDEIRQAVDELTASSGK